MNKTREKIVRDFIQGFRTAYLDAKSGSISCGYSRVPSVFVYSAQRRHEAIKMVEEGLALWLDKDTLGISGKGREVFITNEILASLHNE
jgi:hypothetical protein